MKRWAYTIWIIMGAVMLFHSCSDTLVYDKYEHTPIAGWEKNDILSFDIPPLKTSGTYEQQLGLRVTGVYPFMGLTLIINQSIFPKGKLQGMEKTEKSDTIQCDLIDKSGATKGQGISYYQYNFPINAYRFASGDSIHITVKHNMKREILPGISDIGIKMSHIGE